MDAVTTWTRRTAAGLAVVAAGVLGACAPQAPTTHGPTTQTPTTQAPTTGGIRCSGGTVQTAVSPGFTLTPGANTMSMTSPALDVTCHDRSGAGIGSGRIETIEIAFPSISCFSPAGTSGTGSASVTWSDGSTSAIDVSATLDSAVSGRLGIRVTSGRFAGMTGRTTFSAWPAEGSCSDGGITTETVTLDTFAVAPAGR